GFLDAFNPSYQYDIPLKTGRLVPDKGWVASDYIGIDQGPILAMNANSRTELAREIMRRDPDIPAGLERAGFTGGWLDAGKDKPGEDAEGAGEEADAGQDEAPAPVRSPLKPPEQPNLQSLRMDCQHAPSQANATTPLRPCNGRVGALVRIGVPAHRAAAGL